MDSSVSQNATTATVVRVTSQSTATPPPDFSGFVGYYFDAEQQTGGCFEKQTVCRDTWLISKVSPSQCNSARTPFTTGDYVVCCQINCADSVITRCDGSTVFRSDGTLTWWEIANGNSISGYLYCASSVSPAICQVQTLLSSYPILHQESGKTMMVCAPPESTVDNTLYQTVVVARTFGKPLAA
jgi:hypothetical protein